MSISVALNNAYSGLTAASRTTESISSNIANALTEGYSRRSVALSSLSLNGYGSGVRIDGIERATDRIATGSRREAGTLLQDATARSEATARILQAVGDPAIGNALNDKFAVFEAAITAAANAPSSQTMLDGAARAAVELAAAFNATSSDLMQVRMDAESDIESQVTTLNASMIELRDLNVEIRKRATGNYDLSQLKDRRDQVIDTISGIVPVIVVGRDFDQVALFTPTGGILLDSESNVGQFAFSPTPVISPGMTLGAPLSGLTYNGNTVTIGSGSGAYDGGSLGALFEVRDTIVPSANSQIDALARDLVERFQDPAVDTTLLATDAGLFTDAGGFFNVANESGLAGSITVNAAVDPGQGGASWRLRDGINAAVQGLAGDNTILRNQENALLLQRVPSGNLGVALSMSASGFAGEIVSQFARTSVLDEDATTFASNQFAAFRETENSRTGVDTDAELQRLLENEKIYAANARVINTLDEMLEDLLRI